MRAYGKTKPRRTMRREDYLTGAQAQLDSSLQVVAADLLLRQDEARLPPLIPRQCLRNHRVGPPKSELRRNRLAQEKARIFASYRESIIDNPLIDGAGAAIAAELAQMPMLDLLSQNLQDAAAIPGSDAWNELNALTCSEVSQAIGMLMVQLNIRAPSALSPSTCARLRLRLRRAIGT